MAYRTSGSVHSITRYNFRVRDFMGDSYLQGVAVAFLMVCVVFSTHGAIHRDNIKGSDHPNLNARGSIDYRSESDSPLSVSSFVFSLSAQRAVDARPIAGRGCREREEREIKRKRPLKNQRGEMRRPRNSQKCVPPANSLREPTVRSG